MERKKNEKAKKRETVQCWIVDSLTGLPNKLEL